LKALKQVEKTLWQQVLLHAAFGTNGHILNIRNIQKLMGLIEATNSTPKDAWNQFQEEIQQLHSSKRLCQFLLNCSTLSSQGVTLIKQPKGNETQHMW
jgi:hypothetical protein